MTPWELSPALARDRLEVVARIAAQTRNRAFSEADRAAGDSNWGLACKAHERLMHVLTELCERKAYPWLTIVRAGLYLMPIVDGVAIRIYRGSPDRLSSRHLDAARLEHHRLHDGHDGHDATSTPAVPAPQMAFDFMGTAPAVVDADGPWYWMMAMETDAAGMVTRVVFHQANDAGESRHQWVCEGFTGETAQTQLTPTPTAPVVRLADKRASRERQRAKQAGPATPAGPDGSAAETTEASRAIGETRQTRQTRQEGLLFGDASGAE